MLTRTEINLIAERTAEILYGKTDKLMTSKQCAERLGLTLTALHKRCEKGKIPYHKKHGSLYFFENEITSYVKEEDKPAS